MQFPLRAKLPEAKISRPDRRYLHGTLRKRFTGLIAEVDAPDSAGIAMRLDQQRTRPCALLTAIAID
jgi:hypothetical protein